MPKSKRLPPTQLIREWLDYDSETGEFWWRKSPRGNVRVGSRAGSVGPNGYCYISLHGSKYLAHRLMWYLVHEKDPGELEIDHVDGSRANNKLNNLRLANTNENKYNAKVRNDNSSGYKGVTWTKYTKSWRAIIYSQKRRYHLGYYATAIEAYAVYVTAAKELHGEFAKVA